MVWPGAFSHYNFDPELRSGSTKATRCWLPWGLRSLSGRSVGWVREIDPDCARPIGDSRGNTQWRPKSAARRSLREAEKRIMRQGVDERTMYIRAWVDQYRATPAATTTEKERDDYFAISMEERKIDGIPR